ncbi:Dr1-associated corepressor [Pancytospora philotis]|nr:Dr1-associated corepressor [Pancytospora philotis]
MSEKLSALQKKKKTRFPLSRIKKLMQLNEEIGKTTATVPVIISRGIELFLSDIVTKAMRVAEDQGVSKIQLGHVQKVVDGEPEIYGFLGEVLTEKTDE